MEFGSLLNTLFPLQALASTLLDQPFLRVVSRLHQVGAPQKDQDLLHLGCSCFIHLRERALAVHRQVGVLEPGSDHRSMVEVVGMITMSPCARCHPRLSHTLQLRVEQVPHLLC